MDGFAQSAGLEASSSAQQRSRMATANVENLLGRKPTVTPAHLSRVLYIPRHTSSAAHLPIYDVSDQYRKANLPGALIGSSLFTIRLGLMKTPTGDGMEADVQYLVDFRTPLGDGGGEVPSAKVQQRALGNMGCEADLQFTASSEAEFTIKVASNNPFRTTVPVQVTFPIPASATKSGIFRNPYFSFSLGRTILQWQVHPIEHGPLRYTLVAVDAESGTGVSRSQSEQSVRAIYHHMGLAVSLSAAPSEGVLLLPPRENDRDPAECVIVASLLGLLWYVRGMGVGAKTTSHGIAKKSVFGKILGKN